MNNSSWEFPLLSNVSPSQWEALSQKKIFFGHQSVGQNIIEGVIKVMNSFPELKLNIRETYSQNDFDSPIFGHTLIGKNQDAHSKIDHFKKLMENGLGDKVDMAFFKFCYVDFGADTNIKEIFNEYSDCMAYLKCKYPRVIFFLVTTPLMIKPTGIITAIKRVIGAITQAETDSKKRAIFNTALREKYGNSLFDLATYESTSGSGEIIDSNKSDPRTSFLLPEYSDDGGHLNSLGQKVISSHLLNFMIKEIKKNK